ncbi:Trp biosynthesis-associated membrane protein [Microbacterium deminutum]|uniref:TIGR02234 family membrane protein n=1 Tax=Microbacterium deminutum TaxID=344164 RepID=A0ABN2QE88_9MICO
MRRARMIAVMSTLVIGAVGVVSSTQTWLVVTLGGAAVHTITVSGAAAIPVLAPLSLAVLALGAVLAIAGLVLRYLFGALTVVIAAILAWLTATVAFTHPTSAIAGAVTAATGITGADAVAALVGRVYATAWPLVALAGWILLFAAGALTLATAHRWRGSGRRYRTDAPNPVAATAPSSRPHDAIDSWDDLSRGEDPTARPLD